MSPIQPSRSPQAYHVLSITIKETKLPGLVSLKPGVVFVVSCASSYERTYTTRTYSKENNDIDASAKSCKRACTSHVAAATRHTTDAALEEAIRTPRTIHVGTPYRTPMPHAPSLIAALRVVQPRWHTRQHDIRQGKWYLLGAGDESEALC